MLQNISCSDTMIKIRNFTQNSEICLQSSRKKCIFKIFHKKWRWGLRKNLRHNFEILSKIKKFHFFIASKNVRAGSSGKNKKNSEKKSGKKPIFFHLLLVTSSGLHLFKNLLRSPWGKSGVLNRMKQLSTLYLIVFPLFGHVWNSMAGEPKKKERRFCFAKRR